MSRNFELLLELIFKITILSIFLYCTSLILKVKINNFLSSFWSCFKIKILPWFRLFYHLLILFLLLMEPAYVVADAAYILWWYWRLKRLCRNWGHWRSILAPVPASTIVQPTTTHSPATAPIHTPTITTTTTTQTVIKIVIRTVIQIRIQTYLPPLFHFI